MLRHPGFIAVCACIVASVGCGDNLPTPPTPPAPPPTVTVEFGGRVVNAETAGPVEGVRVSLSSYGGSGGPSSTQGYIFPKNTATSAGDGTFTLSLNLPVGWNSASLQLTAPPGYDDRIGSFIATRTPCVLGSCWVPADRPDIRMYPTLVIRPGESIEVRVDDIVWCGWDGYACRRVLVAGSSGAPVELEVVSHGSSKCMALGLESSPGGFILEPDMSVSRLIVPPGRIPYVIAGCDDDGTGTLTAR